MLDESISPPGMERVFLLPGELYVTKKPAFLATLLGSCVSVCLKNMKNGSAAMTHFVRDRAVGKEVSDIGRFGDLSTQHIIETLFSMDANPAHYQAKIYGGGKVVSTIVAGVNIGETNISVAEEVLENYRIPIVFKDVGGIKGKKIYYNTASFSITVREIGEERKDFTTRNVRVLVVDDSALVRTVLTDVIAATPGMEVCGEAKDAYEARDLIVSAKPDVVSLDIIMPRLDGLAFLEKIMKHAPLPVVIVSTIAQDKSPIAEKAQRLGACGVIDKNLLSLYRGQDVLKRQYVPMLRTAANTAVRR